VEFTSTTLNDVFLGFTSHDLKEQPEGGFMERYAQYD
jgi:ABC-2 type transport system ATP-binding protein